VRDIVARVQTYVPGYRLMGEPVVEDRRERPLRLPEGEAFAGFRVSVLLEVEGNGDWLPPWAGNLDIMTSAAVRVGELLARHQGRVGGGA
jgi:acetaldehyde dehydrogenase